MTATDPPRPLTSVNKGGDGEVLAEDTAASMLRQLAGLSDPEVIARASSSAIRDPGKGDAIEIGRCLKARYLQDGGVQSAGGRLRVAARCSRPEESLT